MKTRLVTNIDGYLLKLFFWFESGYFDGAANLFLIFPDQFQLQ